MFLYVQTCMHLESHLAMRVHSRCARVAARTRAHMLASERYARKVITLAFQDMRGLEHRKTTCIYVQYTNYPCRHTSTYPMIPIIDVMKHSSVQSPPFRHLAYVHILEHRWCANDAQPMTKRMASRPYAI